MTGPASRRVSRHYPGMRVRVDLPRPVQYDRRGEPLPLANRGTVLASDCTAAALTRVGGEYVPNPAAPDPATIRYTVRLDTGGILTDVEGSRLDRDDEEEPRERLRERYAQEPGYRFGAAELIADVAFQEWCRQHPDGYTTRDPIAPTDEDILDALAALAHARHDLDRHEAYLLDQARERGVTWETIGLTLGYKPDGARSGAQGRRSRLKRKASR